jgi:AcrR family transcriptional regulator
MRKLLDAAMIAFDERGYYDTRVNDVVNIAKTSHGTFYLYFSNKEDLLRALVDEAGSAAQYLADALDRSPELGDRPQWDDVRGWVSVYSDLWIRYAALFRAWTDLARIDPALADTLRRTFTVMSDALARQITPDAGSRVNRQTAAMAVLAMLDRFHYVREFVRQPVDDVALDTLTTIIYRALFDESLAGPTLKLEPSSNS